LSDPTPPGNRSHLERLLTTWASQSDSVTAGRLRLVVGVTVVAQMLDSLRDEEGRHLFLFKGGASLQMRFGLRARATQDLDAVYRGEMDAMVERFTAAVETGWSGFDGIVTNVQPITRARLEPPPIRMKAKLRYRGKSFVTIPCEVSRAEAHSADEPELVSVAITLDAVQLAGRSEMPFLPLRYQIAQKLHACSEPSTEGQVNDRARDLVDLLMIEELAVTDDDLDAVRDACIEIFESRDMHAWPPTIAAAQGWDLIWAQLAEAEGLESTLAEAIDAVGAFVRRIAAEEAHEN